LPFKVKKATLNGENIAFNTKDKTIEIPIAWKKGKVKLEIEY
jgi:hypothetical protein